MEQAALKMSSAFFEKIGMPADGQFLHQLLMSIFQSLHFYRNNTKSKVIPAVIMKHVHAFFATFMVCQNTQTLVEGCNKIQPDILFMILKSESKSMKYVTEPARDKKYTIVAYARLLQECAAFI